MRITHFVENLNRGGLERMVIELARLQQRQGHQCNVICLFEQGSLAQELADAGIAVEACHKRSGLDLRALWRARRLLRAHRTELLHTHNAVAHYYAALAAFGTGVRRIISTRHSMVARESAHRREQLYRWALHRTHAVVTVCKATAEDAIRRGVIPRDKARVIPNGIRLDDHPLVASTGRGGLRASLGLPASTRVLGSVGRLSWVKDQAGMIRAFAIVCRELSDTVLVLVGDGDKRSELEQCARAEGVAERVHLLGDRDDVPALLQQFDLFVLSSLSEGYSMALLEASATGLPIVATDVGGNREILNDGATGVLVPAADPPALAEALLGLLSDEQRAAALGLAAQQWVKREGTLDVMAARYDALYRESSEP